MDQSMQLRRLLERWWIFGWLVGPLVIGLGDRPDLFGAALVVVAGG